MNVNRNTINADLEFWYSEIGENVNIVNPEEGVVNWLEQMDIQISRLREQLDKAKSHSERMTIERLIYEINSRILNTHFKLSNSMIRLNRLASKMLNDHMEKNKDSSRYLTYFDRWSVSEKTKKKIDKVLKEGRWQRG